MKQRIMKIAMQGLDGTSPVRFTESVVISSNPLKIRLGDDARMIIPEELIIVAERLTKHERTAKINGSEQTIEFTDELQTGDKVMVAVLQGGQSFFISDRID